jgi:hypothetical protein
MKGGRIGIGKIVSMMIMIPIITKIMMRTIRTKMKIPTTMKI